MIDINTLQFVHNLLQLISIHTARQWSNQHTIVFQFLSDIHPHTVPAKFQKFESGMSPNIITGVLKILTIHYLQNNKLQY